MQNRSFKKRYQKSCSIKLPPPLAPNSVWLEITTSTVYKGTLQYEVLKNFMTLYTEPIMIKPLWSEVKFLVREKLKEVMPWTLLYPYIWSSDICFSAVA